jgi:hypothetical protein
MEVYQTDAGAQLIEEVPIGGREHHVDWYPSIRDSLSQVHHHAFRTTSTKRGQKEGDRSRSGSGDRRPSISAGFGQFSD